MKKILSYVKKAFNAYLKKCAENYVFRITGDCTVYVDPTTGTAHVFKNGK